MLKKIVLIFFVTTLASQADSINTTVYKTLSTQSYSSNYNRQVSNQAIPYWQAQSNYASRNRLYSDYATYTRHANSVNQYNTSRNSYRRMY